MRAITRQRRRAGTQYASIPLHTVGQVVQSNRLLALGREIDRRPEQAGFDGDGAQGGDRRTTGARVDSDLDLVFFQRDTPWRAVGEALAPVARLGGAFGTFLVITPWEGRCVPQLLVKRPSVRRPVFETRSQAFR